MKRKIVGIVSLLLIALCPVFAEKTNDYQELTNAEVEAYLDSITIDELYAEIRKLDAIEHIRPVVDLPTLILAFTGRDAIVSYVGDARLYFRVGTYLSYSIQLDPKRFIDVVPQPRTDFVVVSVAVGAAVSAIVTYAAHDLDLWSIPIGAAGGALAGGILFAILNNK